MKNKELEVQMRRLVDGAKRVKKLHELRASKELLKMEITNIEKIISYLKKD